MRSALARFLLPGFLFVLIVGAALFSRSSGGAERSGSAFSTGGTGRRASYRLLAELGFDVRAWTRAPGLFGEDFSARNSVLLIAAVPSEPMSGGPPTDEEEASGGDTRRLRDRLHYLRYMEDGGTILGYGDHDLWQFFSTVLEIDPLAELHEEYLDSEESSVSSKAFLGSGEELALEWPIWPPPPAGSGSSEIRFEILLADAEERPIAYSIEIERGRLILLSSEYDPFDNATIEKGDHALLLVRLVEEFARGGPVLFDEYALGLWSPTSPLELAFAPQSLLFTLHLLLFTLLLFWRMAWSKTFPRDPEVFEGVSPLARARGFAALLVRRKRFDLLGHILRRGVIRRLGRRIDRSSGRSEKSSVLPQALPAMEVEAVLSALMSTKALGKAAYEEARALFLGEVPVDLGTLERLGGKLAALEATLGTERRRASKFADREIESAAVRMPDSQEA